MVALLQELDIPTTQMMWYPAHVPDMPYVVLVPARTDNVFTDGTVRMKVTPYLIEVYSEQRDIPLELKIEEAFNNIGLPWNRYHTTMQDNGVILAVYQVLLEEV